MTKSTITRERLQEIAEDGFLKHGENKVLARMALAAMKGEPVILYRERNPYNGLTTGWQELTENEFSFLKENAGENAEFVTLYRHAQPAPERDQVRSEHAEWSQATFGNVGPIGPLKHLSKEALEAAAEPGDLSEWADMQFLLWDAQRRAGITDEQITQAMIEKLAVNKQREWPEPKNGEPRLHIKAQPAPVVQCPFPCGWDNLNKLAIQDAALVARGLVEGELTTEAHRQAAISNNDRLLKVISACLAAMLQAEPVKTANKLGNSPSQSPIDHGYRKGCECSGCKTTVRICAELAGWIPVSERMPENDVSVLTFDGMYKRVHHAMYGHWQCWEPEKITHWMPLPASPQEVNHG
ncbi:dATP/dGTP pyrophosphohydrolase domain-containing protein [Klebsiella aerogenes]|uniref:dATP/dGTP pyrophosphohydrolase domain-containing protein n=1 Tax=Klebsiella aerogenes TaxID=548 RepID=UPI0009078829|nr:dATP/dGTP pyrophosphohydrolase domain-containing protein [Klebsiella aerogenes]